MFVKLDRNITNPRRGKYALIKLREVQVMSASTGEDSRLTVRPHSAVDFGDTEDSDFFVIRIKDKYAAMALQAYADAAREDDPEYADEIVDLARVALNHPNRKRPD